MVGFVFLAMGNGQLGTSFDLKIYICHQSRKNDKENKNKSSKRYEGRSAVRMGDRQKKWREKGGPPRRGATGAPWSACPASSSPQAS